MESSTGDTNLGGGGGGGGTTSNNINDAATNNIFGRVVVNPFLLNVVDVDGVVRRIDMNALLQRIDFNMVLDTIDWNEVVLDRVDWDRHLSRIDFNSIVNRVSVDSIVAQSTTGIFTSMLDQIRTHVVLADLYLHMVVRCKFRERRAVLPPAPGRRQRSDRINYPRGRSNKAIAVQGRCCGFVSKSFAILTDVITVTILFSFVLIVLQLSWIYFMGLSKESASEKVDKARHGWVIILYCIFWFLYFFLSVLITGQTVGMAIVGLKVCDVKSKSTYTRLSFYQAFVRTALLPVTLTLCPPLGVFGLLRRDGKMLHDLIARTGIIYLWDAKLAKLRERLRAEQDSEVDSSSSSDDDDDDDFEEDDNEKSSKADAEPLTRRQGSWIPISSSQYSTFPDNV